VTALNGTGTAANITYDMSRKVANALKTKVVDLTGATAIITRGDNFPDAIGVSPLACANLWPIILTNRGGAVLHPSAAATLADLGITKTIKVGTYATMPGGVTGLANLSGADRYDTNARVAAWAKNNAGLSFAHLGIATGDKFPDALASGPYLAKEDGILLLSPLLGPLPALVAAQITANAAAVQHVTFIAMIEPVIGQVKALLP
jgi:putative cell wall-binding protein